MLYDKVNTDLNFVDREKEVNDFWKKEDIFQKSMKQREGAPYYTFYDGPPTANGKPHIGHVLTRVIKDMIPRYHAMKGQYVPRKAGWDTHGLPVELQVEKELGLNGKEQIEAYASRTIEQRRELPGLQPKRADVILAGACILKDILKRLDAPQLTISDRGLRHGLAFDLLN